MAIKWLRHPNGVEVAVKAKDAEEHRDRIMGEYLKAKAKNPVVTILDKPTEGAKSDKVAKSEEKASAAKPAKK